MNSNIGGPEIAPSLNSSIEINIQTERGKIPSSMKNQNDIVKQQIIKISKNIVKGHQNDVSSSFFNSGNSSRQPLENSINVNGSIRNLQNIRNKRIGNQPQQNGQQQVRAPPIQNGLYFSNLVQSNGNTSNQRYQQAALGQQAKSNGNHQKVQSLDASSIFKTSVNAHHLNNSQIPQLTTITSSKNHPISMNNSIEKINKNISDSISKGNLKEFQLIQAYQQQKWKDQLTQRIQSPQNSLQNKFVPVNTQKSRIIGGGNLSSRLKQEAVTQDSSTFSSTLDEEYRLSNIQIVKQFRHIIYRNFQ